MKYKKIIAGILTFTIILGTVPQINAEAPIAASESAGMSLSEENMQISGTNSFGNMVAQELASVSSEQEANNGCNVFSVEISGTTANVSFETLCDSALVVAIYDNEGMQMITSGYKEVTAEETETELEILGTIPQYFYIRAYLVNPDTLRPLSTEYSSPMYTREMQEFLSKTTADFDSDRVLNLDDNPDTNFAVFSEDTTLIHENGKTNVVISANEATLTYVFENPDDNLLALDVGGVFAFEYNDELLILKAVSVEKSVDKDTSNVTSVTVIGQEAELEDAFEHLRIDGEANSDRAVIDDSDMDEGVTCGGLVDDEESRSSPQTRVDVTGKSSKSINFNIAEKKSGSFEFSSDLNVKIGTSAKVYLSFSEIYVEFKLDLTAKISLEFEVSATIKMKEAKMRLAYIAIYICPGVYFSVTPEFVLELSGKASIEGTLSVTVGFKVSKNGIENLSSAPKFVAKGGIEVTIFIGFLLKPALSVVHEKVFNLSLDTKSGVEITAKVEASTEKDPTCIHECDICIDGEIKGKFSIDITIKLLDSEKLKFKLSLLEVSVHLWDFYISPTFGEFAFSKCPHYKYQTFLVVKNRDSDYISGATIIIDKDKEYITNDKGEVEVWLAKGKHSTEIKATDYITKTSTLNIKEGGKHFKVTIEKGDDKSSEDLLSDVLDEFKSGSSNPEDLDYGKSWDLRVKEVVVNDSNTAVITTDGTLYMWGDNSYGQIGNGQGGTQQKINIPTKIMNNVKHVNIDSSSVAAITNNGNLYMWGYNGSGQLGDGTKISRNTPQKIMSNVSLVSRWNNATAAVTTDGSLYFWGAQVQFYGDGGNIYISDEICNPQKILDNIAFVNLGNSSAALTNDGELYMWGDNQEGQLGVGSLEYNYYKPKSAEKILSNIAFIDSGDSSSAAITTDGSLYTWGNNECGQLGDGTTNSSCKPIKLMDNVAYLKSNSISRAAITNDGALYTWGYNLYGNLGNGTTENILCPTKIMDNVVYVNVDALNMIVITVNDDLFVCGNNSWGQLGDGSNKSITAPKKIMSNIRFVSSKLRSVSAITVNDELYTWGENDYYGILGNGTLKDSNIPVKIANNIAYANLNYNMSFITVSGELYMCGGNYYGQLGNGTTESSSVPIKVDLPTTEDNDGANSAEPATLYYASPYAMVSSTLTNLLPNEIYNIYSVGSRTSSNILSPNNLLYIGQAVSDRSGNLTIPTAAQTGTVFIKAMHEFNVYNAPIISAEVNNTSVSLQWEPVENATEYEIYCYTTNGILSQTKTSATSFTINNLEKGKYYGFLVTSTVHGEQSVPAIGDVRMLLIDNTLTGDVNADSKVNDQDSILLSRYLAEWGNTIDTAAADMNGDGKINDQDSIVLSRTLAGWYE